MHRTVTCWLRIQITDMHDTTPPFEGELYSTKCGKEAFVYGWKD